MSCKSPSICLQKLQCEEFFFCLKWKKKKDWVRGEKYTRLCYSHLFTLLYALFLSFHWLTSDSCQLKWSQTSFMPEATQCLENATHCKFSNVVSWLFFNWPPRCDLTGKLIKKVIADAQNHGRQCFFIHDHILTYRIARTRVISEGTDNEFIAYEQYTEFQYDVLFSHLKRVSIWCLIYECYNFWQTSKMGKTNNCLVQLPALPAFCLSITGCVWFNLSLSFSQQWMHGNFDRLLQACSWKANAEPKMVCRSS